MCSFWWRKMDIKRGKVFGKLGGEAKKKGEISGSYKVKENHKLEFVSFPHHQNKQTNKNTQHYLIYLANISLIYQLSFDSLVLFAMQKYFNLYEIKFINYCLQLFLNFESQLESLPLHLD